MKIIVDKILYYPHRVSELTIKQHHASRESVYIAFEKIVKENERKFKFVTTPTWGDIDDAMNPIETSPEQLFDIDSLKSNET